MWLFNYLFSIHLFQNYPFKLSWWFFSVSPKGGPRALPLDLPRQWVYSQYEVTLRKDTHDVCAGWQLFTFATCVMVKNQTLLDSSNDRCISTSSTVVFSMWHCIVNVCYSVPLSGIFLTTWLGLCPNLAILILEYNARHTTMSSNWILLWSLLKILYWLSAMRAQEQ